VEEIGIGQPNAEGAEISQKSQKSQEEISKGFFCDFCETFASSAFGSRFQQLTKT